MFAVPAVFARIRVRAPVALTSLLLGLGCARAVEPSLTPGSEPELELSSRAPAVFVERKGPPPPGVVELGPPCPAEVGIAPSAFFHDQLLVRLPPGVEGDSVPEQGPGFARSQQPVAMGCAPELEATVFLDRSLRKHEELPGARRRIFRDLNLPEEQEIVVLRGAEAEGDVSFALAFPDHAVWGGTRVYMRLVSVYERVYAIGFLAEASSYHQLEPLFAASADTLLALPES